MNKDWIHFGGCWLVLMHQVHLLTSKNNVGTFFHADIIFIIVITLFHNLSHELPHILFRQDFSISTIYYIGRGVFFAAFEIGQN